MTPPIAPSALGETLECLCDEIVQRAPHLHLWEPDYALWVSMRLVTVLREQHHEPDAHERVLNHHGPWVADIAAAIEALHSKLSVPFARYIKLPGQQNEIQSDIVVFADKITDTPRVGNATHGTLFPWPGMPSVDALVEMKLPVGVGFKRIRYARDVVKVAAAGEFYRWRFDRPVPYLGAWILDLKGHGPAAFKRYYLPDLPGTERVRVVVFQPGHPPHVLRQADPASG